MWEDQTLSQYSYKGTSGGLAICLSACEDNQISVDTTVSLSLIYLIICHQTATN